MEVIKEDKLRKIIIPGIIGQATANEFFFVINF
jgi:hypothetical protein